MADDLSVARNLFMGKEPQKSIGPLDFLDIEKMKEESGKILKELGLGVSSMDQRAEFCSGGERQGVAIARAMYFEADLVILDEPTRALGVPGVRRVLELVDELKNRGISNIYISHNLNRTYSVADRFVLLRDGEKVTDVPREETSPDELADRMSKT